MKGNTFLNRLIESKAVEAICGYPFRHEVFYYAHRRGGRHLMPLDVKAYLKAFKVPKNHKDPIVAEAFLDGTLKVCSVQAGCWFFDHEPAIIVKGPSLRVSCLEDAITQLNFRVQIATLAHTDMLHAKLKATCEAEKDIIDQTLETVSTRTKHKVEVCSDEYLEAVLKRKQEIEDVVGPNRYHVEGLRDGSCYEQYKLVADTLNSDCWGYTTRLEHLQRYPTTYEAYMAIHDRAVPAKRNYPVSSAAEFDELVKTITEGTIFLHVNKELIGLKETIGLLSYITSVIYNQDLELSVIVVGDLSSSDIRSCDEMVPRNLGVEVSYAIGEWFMKPPWEHALVRSTVQAEYHLACTGGRPTMSKQPRLLDIPEDILTTPGLSIPGDLFVWSSAKDEILISLKGESPPSGFWPVQNISFNHNINARTVIPKLTLSAGILKLVSQQVKLRQINIVDDELI